jgi:N-acetylmuramoyl-L-alanine amidase
MKRIFCLFFVLITLAPVLRGQGSPSAAEVAARQEAEENYKTLSGTVDDLLKAQQDTEKQLNAINKQIADLRDQAGKPAGNYASQDDLKRLADAIQEIDKKREADKELILHEIAKLGKTISTGSSRPSSKPATIDESQRTQTPTSAAGTGTDPNQSGYTYTIKGGDTYGQIAKAYREQGIKVTSMQIEKANPGVDPTKLVIGQKILIPAPAAK